MRRVFGWVSLAALGVVVACGGAEFEAGPPSGDASGPDAHTGANDGSGADGGPASEAESPDAAQTDAPPMDATEADGTQADAPQADAPTIPDAMEEPLPPHCAGSFACVPSVPSGWSGPVELYAGMNAPPLCSGVFGGGSLDGHAGLTAGGATCGCSCDAAKGAVCAPPKVTFAESLTCSQSAAGCATVGLSADTCMTEDALGSCGGLSALLDLSMGAPVTSIGSCAPLATQTVPPVSWAQNARACASSVASEQEDCVAGSVCAPVSAPPFDRALCIAQAGDVPCPNGGYSARRVFYAGVADTRGCSDCSCGAVKGTSCSAQLSVFSSSDQSCTGSAITYQAPISCAGVQQPADFRMATVLTKGTCEAASVNPVGLAQPAQPTTYCCEP